MKSQHRITIARIPSAQLQHGLTRRQVDARNTNSRYPSLLGTGDNSFEILGELLTVKMAMGINQSHQL
jgi:hypothetical protein